MTDPTTGCCDSTLAINPALQMGSTFSVPDFAWDTRKWLLSKALPKIYGDKSPVESNTEPQMVVHLLERPYEGLNRYSGTCAAIRA